MGKKENILQPQYVQKFQCIGGECEDNCCMGDWNIFIDKATYELYENCPDPEFFLKLQKYVIRTNINAGDSRYYARMKTDKEKGCCFLDEENFCSIQRVMGEEYLSLTCAVYPRIYNIANGILENSISLSCPEAARQALLDPKTMEFEFTEEDARTRRFFTNKLNTDNPQKSHNPEKYLFELRVFSISLLQNRSYPLWQRLVILGLFCNNLHKLIADNKINEILPLITTYLEQIKTHAFDNVFENNASALNLQIGIIQQIINSTTHTGDRRFGECVSEALQGINYSEKLPKDELTAQYTLVYENYYQPFMSKHEYILENYLVNYVFATLFPCKNGKNVFADYILLTVHYAMVKMLLVGMAGVYKEKFNQEHVLKLIQSLTKVITHNEVFLNSIVDWLKENKMDNMPYMSVLIKD
jgi:lysine-N-methylase